VKYTGLGEVKLLQLVLLDLKTALNDFVCLLTADGCVASNLFVTANAERADSVSSFRENGLLAGQGLDNACSLGELIPGFSDGTVDNQFVNEDFPHLGIFTLSWGSLEDERGEEGKEGLCGVCVCVSLSLSLLCTAIIQGSETTSSKFRNCQ
jgi:hypothetical protein